ncbi:MAG: glycosyltransferase, partial [Pseudacidovorax sp.]|nr:glycosyltransferase [Pseudacidovorax sp.]
MTVPVAVWSRWTMLVLRNAPELALRIPVAWRVWRKVGWRGLLAELRCKLRPETDYLRWVREHDTITPPQREALRARAAALADGPLISVLMPCYNPDPQFLRAAIASVQAQLYGRWQLCIADDASPAPEVRQVLEA